MKLGIIGAMKEEIAYFKEVVENLQEKKKGLLTFYTGTSHGHELIICQSGVGKVNAAMVAQILIDVFQVEQIIFTGVAGGIDEELNVEDVVISTICQEHDIDASPLGFERGTIPMYEGSSQFIADDELVEKAFQSASNVLEDKSKVVKGKIISGDQFIADIQEVSMLRNLFSPACVEMEGAAVAHVCHFNKIPFVIIRSISDKANGEAPESFESFVEKVALTSSKIVVGILEKYNH